MSVTALAYLGLYFGLLVKALMSRPIFGLYAYLLAFYANPISRWWGQSIPDLRWSFLAAVLTLLLIFAKPPKDGINWLKFKESKLFLAFLIFLFVQYLWVLSPNIHSIYVSLVVKYLILIFLLQNCIKTKQDIIGFIVANLIGCLYFSYLAQSYGGGRLEGIGGPGVESANGLGQHLAIALIFISYLVFVKLGKWKMALLLAIIVVLNTLMMTESRGSLLSLAGVGVVSIFFIPKQHKKLFLTMLCLGAAAFLLLMGSQLIERFKNMQKDDAGQIQDKSAASRLVIIEAQYQMFKQQPFLGQGHRTTLLLSPLYLPEEYRTSSSKSSSGVSRRASHNFIMGILVDHGIVGLTIYLIIVYLCLKRLFYVNKLGKDPTLSKELTEYKVILTGCCLALLCYMLAGLFSNNKIYEIAIWLFALIPLIHHQIESKRKVEHVD